MLSSLNERRLGVSKLVYIENDLSTSAEVIGAYLEHEKSLSEYKLFNNTELNGFTNKNNRRIRYTLLYYI